MKELFKLLPSLILFLAIPIVSLAQQDNLQQQIVRPSIEVSPAILNISLSPGKTYSYKITIKNHSSVPLPIRAAMEKLEEGVPSLTEWISVNPQDLLIPAGEEQILTLTVQIPRKIAIGGYYGNMFLDILSPFPSQVGESSVQPRIGVLILSNIGIPQKGPKAEITSFKIRKIFTNQESPIFNYDVKNISLHHFSGKPFITIKPLIGRAEKYTLDEKIVLPGRTRQWESSIDLKNRQRGIYRATLEFSTGGGETVNKSIIFFNFPFVKTLIWLTLISVALFFVKHGRNTKKALRTLLGK